MGSPNAALGDPFEGSEITTILVTSDLEESKRFYLDVLGAEFYREYGGTSVVIRLLGNWVLLTTAGEPTEDKPGIRFAPNSDPNEIYQAFTIRVKDCQRSYEILRARGARFITPPYDWGAEVRRFFRDPDGSLFEISEYRGG